ncbi:MAG: tetratricopeptide repeat protein, partial [Oscillospiraceae bacterium]|nr:tetratricopeptide repeat protein [Oscillospiraceae bacterium]
AEDPEDWVCLIAAYRYAGDEESAYEWFSAARSKFSDKAVLYVYGGDACRNLKKYDEAFQCWRKALELDDEMYDARYSMGFCYEELGEYGKAYDMWLEIARDLEKEGYEIEKRFPLELAEKCKAILADHLK